MTAMAGSVCAKCGSALVGDSCSSCGELGVSAPGLELIVEHEPAREIEQTRKRTAAAYLSLQPSETAVLQAASNLLAGFIASGAVTEANENELSDRAVRLATRMALVIEKYVQSDSEDW